MIRSRLGAVTFDGIARAVGIEKQGARRRVVRRHTIEAHHRRRKEAGDVLRGIPQCRALPVDQALRPRNDDVARAAIRVEQDRAFGRSGVRMARAEPSGQQCGPGTFKHRIAVSQDRRRTVGDPAHALRSRHLMHRADETGGNRDVGAPRLSLDVAIDEESRRIALFSPPEDRFGRKTRPGKMVQHQRLEVRPVREIGIGVDRCR